MKKKSVNLIEHYRCWSFESILVDVAIRLSERFRERVPEIIQWAVNDNPEQDAEHLERAGIERHYVDDVALAHLTQAFSTYRKARLRLIEVINTYESYVGEEMQNGK